VISLENNKIKNTTYDPRAYRTPDGLPTDICIFTITSEAKSETKKSLPRRELKVLLIRRKQYDDRDNIEAPYQGYWALPGGFSGEKESLYEAALRELREETNITGLYIKQVGTYYYPNRDPRGWMPTVAYYALVKEEHLSRIKADDDAEEVGLFTIKELEQMNLAFDHKKIIFGGLTNELSQLDPFLIDVEMGALEKIKEKMLTTTIAKEFLEEEFTITELLDVIQSVVPEFKVASNNFIKKMVGAKSRQGIIEEATDARGVVKKTNRNSQIQTKLYRFTDFEPKISIYNSTFI
jgi:8-oxo-dGTP diphosphatase